MNPFYNPLFLLKILKSYSLDIPRLHKWNSSQLRTYQDKQLRAMVKFAYTVPLYHDKYKTEGITPSDIKGVHDIQKLPFISKEDIKQYYPTGIISRSVKKEHLIEVSTSGTTGKSLSIFVDMYDIVLGLFGYLRTIQEYGLSWRKQKLTIIGDFAPTTAESGYITKGLQPRLSSRLFFKNIQWLNTNEGARNIIQKIDKFQPDFIGGYVGMLGHLAVHKEQGLGPHISPSHIAATGSVLDPFLKQYIAQTFNAHVFEVYGTTETGPIAFECRKGKYHIMSDFLHLEFFKNGTPVASHEPGEVVITKLFGGGTPIIRYNAINDIVAPNYDSCTCDLAGDCIEKIYGRKDLSLVLPDGHLLLSTAFSEIFSRVLYELHTTKLIDTRIIQQDLHHIEVQLVIDKKQRTSKPSVDEIISVVKEGFQQKAGPDVTITVQEVDHLETRVARIVSKVDRRKFQTGQYL